MAKARTRKKEKVRFIVTEFPEGTKEIFISGDRPELGEWNPEKALKLQYYQNEGTKEYFFIDLEFPVGSSVAYKYLNHPTWANVECGVVAQDVPDRHITIKETSDRVVEDEVRGFRL